MERIATRITEWTGSSMAFLIAVMTVCAWVVSGPLFQYSTTWQLVINTGTTIVTFLMVFLIQRAQNKESLALQLKLNELVAAMHGASNRLVSVEDLSEDELEVIRKHYRRLAEMSKAELDIRESHSLDEAAARHRSKGRNG